MSPAEILAAVRLFKGVAGAISEFMHWVACEVELAGQRGELTPEQRAEIEAEIGLSRDEWDAKVAAARSRLGL